MPEPSPLPASVVARLSTDQATALAIGDALTDSLEAEEVAAAWSEEADGRWSLAVHFRDPPNETAVRALVALAAGRQREPNADHHRAEDDGPAHPHPFGDVAHDDAAGAEADPGQ